ncbi:MAG: DUF1854 domain-containing protein [Phycisphaerales bacterium]|nr:DUF1854 domain-containing protein [Phycisphaerales bacterium]
MSESFHLSINSTGQLLLHRPGCEDVSDVRLRRAFPWSMPDRFISVRNAEGKELILIEDLSQLPQESQQLVERYLRQNSFVPKINRIHSVNLRFGYQQWDVQTDRGSARFRVQEREDIRFLSDGRFTLRDADGNIYELPPLNQMDAHSRRAVEALV